MALLYHRRLRDDALTANNVVLVPIRSGIGLRLGANIGYLKYNPRAATWNRSNLIQRGCSNAGARLVRIHINAH